jgi:hypothetical protein
MSENTTKWGTHRNVVRKCTGNFSRDSVAPVRKTTSTSEASSDCGQMKLSVTYVAGFEFRCANEGGLALEKTLIIETENTAQKMNLQRNARKGILGE